MQAREAYECQRFAVPRRQIPGVLGFSDDGSGYPYSVFSDAAEFIAGIGMVFGGVHHGQQDRVGGREVHVSPRDPDKTRPMVTGSFRGSHYPGVHATEAVKGEGIEKRLLVTEMLAGRRVAHPQVPGELPQRKSLNACFFNEFHGTGEQRLAERAVMVGLTGHAPSLYECSH